MNETQKPRSENETMISRARLWRNIFAATAAAMTAQLVFSLGRPNVLIVMGIIILPLWVGFVLTELRLRRVIGNSAES